MNRFFGELPYVSSSRPYSLRGTLGGVGGGGVGGLNAHNTDLTKYSPQPPPPPYPSEGPYDGLTLQDLWPITPGEAGSPSTLMYLKAHGT